MNPIEALKMHGVGVGKKLVGDAQSGDVRAGRTFSNAQGNDKVGTMPVRSLVAQTITPGVNNITKQAGIYDGDITILGDTDLVATNIKQGTNIFGVAGSYVGKQFATGTLTSLSSNINGFKNYDGATVSRPAAVVSGLTFIPSLILLTRTDSEEGVTLYSSRTLGTSSTTIAAKILIAVGESYFQLDGTAAYVNATGFRLPVGLNSWSFDWLAYE